MRPTWLCMSFALVGVLLAGDGGPASGAIQDESEAGVRVRDSAGVRIVENPGPVWGPREGWSVEPEPFLTLGTLDSGGPEQFNGISQAIVLSGGGFAVSDRQSLEIRVFNGDGSHRVTLGGRGGGPGEFEDIPFLAASGDTLVVWDPGNRRMTWFAGEGRVVQERSMRAEVADARIHRCIGCRTWEVSGDGTLLARNTYSLDEGDSGGTYLRRPTLFGPEAGTVLSLGLHVLHEAVRIPGSRSFVTHEFAPRRPVALLRSDSLPLVVGGDEGWELRLYRWDGSLARMVRADVPSYAVTDEAWREEMEGMAESTGLPPGEIRQAFGQLPRPDSVPVGR